MQQVWLECVRWATAVFLDAVANGDADPKKQCQLVQQWAREEYENRTSKIGRRS